MKRVEINGLNEPTETTEVDDNYRPVSGEIDIDCDHPFQITGEACPNCGVTIPISIRAFVSGNMDADDLTRRLVKDGVLEL